MIVGNAFGYGMLQEIVGDLGPDHYEPFYMFRYEVE
jgi:hypothetical protein